MSQTQLSTKSEEKGLQNFVQPVISELSLVEEQLNKNLIDDNSFIDELLGMLFKSGGKRIRPLLVLHSAKATGMTEEKKSLQIILAVLTELIHSASLVHDDILDNASVRRGTETVNKRFSDKMAVLLGDLLFAQASICLANIKSPVIVGIYGQVLGDLCAGEIQQMKQQFSTNIAWADYIKKSVSKTASLFAAGTHSAAILNDADKNIVDSLKSYGLNLGICFQIVDDILDYTGNTSTLGKAAGSDLKSGIITAPALYILERKDKIAQELENLIATKKVCEQDGLARALQLINDYAGVDSAKALASKHGAQAKESLNILPDTVYKQSLIDFTDFVLNRVN